MMPSRILIDSGPSRRGFSRLSTFLRCPQHYVHRGYANRILRMLWDQGVGYGEEGGDPLVFEELEARVVPPEGGVSELEALAHDPDSPPLLKGGIIHTGTAHLLARLGAAQGGVVVSGYTLPDDMVSKPGETAVYDVLGGVVPGIEWLPGSDVLVTDPAHFLEPEEAIEKWCVTRPAGERFRALAENCVRKYAQNYRDDGEKLRIVAVEREHELGEDALGFLNMEGHPDHGKGLHFTARIDYEFQLWDGTTGAVFTRGPNMFYGDHKTTVRITNKAKSYYSLHGQFTGYRVMGAREWGPRFAGVQLNLIETSGEAFQRPPLEPSPGWTSAFIGRVKRAEHDIARLELATLKGEIDPFEWPGAIQEMVCFHRYGACDAATRCRFGGV